MSIGTLFWIVWVGSGLAFELWAIFSKKARFTLTWQWRWVRDHLGKPLAVAWIAGTAIGIAWLFGHFILEVW